MNKRLIVIGVLLTLLAACRLPGEEPAPATPAARARIEVKTAGAYALDARALRALGWTAGTPLALNHGEQRLPLVERDGKLVFWVPARSSRYSENQVVVLTAGGEATTATAIGDVAAGNVSELALGELVQTEEHIYNPKAPGAPWFWQQLIAPKEHPFTLSLPGRVDGPVTVEVALWGVTDGDHAMEASLAGAQAEPMEWSGSSERMTVTVTAPQAPAGDLQLVLRQPAPEQGIDVSLLDQILVRYPMRLEARDDALDFQATSDGVLAVRGLSGTPVVWQFDAQGLPSAVAVQWADGVARFPGESGKRYAVRGPKGWQGSEAVRTDEALALREAPMAGDYIAIVAPALQEATRPLLEHRRAQGLQVVEVTPQALYDAFGSGQRDPEAIRAFLRHAAERWNPAPRYVLLVGDTTYDVGGYLEGSNALDPAAMVPSPFVNTVFGGWTVSDNLLADLDGNGYPDLALGRIPARTPAEVTVYVNKVLAYEKSPVEGDWRQRVVMAADGQEPQFQGTSEEIKSRLPSGTEVQTFYPPAGQDATDQLRPLLSAGSLLVNYVGHGSVDQWGKDKLLTNEVAQTLDNGGRLPVVINMTCLAGLFSHPSEQSLAEVLLFNPSGGAIAALAPTSLTLPSDQHQMNGTLLEGLINDRLPIGEAVDKAKRSVELTTPNSHDVVATFNLLGDPALRIVGSGQTAARP